ncbi:MAG: DUF58 domain-containing protein, partial [Phycisphaerales bacterium]|nr:DUF58 domain-containing protein [Phycisphaerales bacterium]
GGQIGYRRSPSRGTGLEFADHKEYSPGDDIRYIDWNVYAHLEELFVKIFEQEEALPLYVMLDTSASMSVGGEGGGPSKLTFAANLAAALTYVGLANQDNVRVSLFADGKVASTKIMSGKTRIYEVLDRLDKQAEGRTDLTSAIEAFSAENPTAGMVFMISDFLDPAGLLTGVRLLAGRKFAVQGIHMVAPQELAPDVAGDVELEDVEDGRRLRMATRRDTMQKFQAFFLEHCDGIRAELAKYGARYLRLLSDQSLEEVLFTRLPKEGVLR